ncbi:hypothetical protein [uncultured Bacteroides sp.]|nr:hypothetical protein [uncultured Bacteroides sp.]
MKKNGKYFVMISLLSLVFSQVVYASNLNTCGQDSEGMDVVTLHVGSQSYANNCPEKYPDAYAIVSLTDLKTYPVDYALANPRNVDFRFYCHGSEAVPRLYSMHALGLHNKEDQYKGTSGSLMDMSKRNQTHFLILPSDFDYEHATPASIAQIDPSTVNKGILNPISVGDVIAFRTKGRVGIMKVIDITQPGELSNVPVKRVMTLEIKFPKKK